MLAKISKYAFEIIAGIAIFVAIVYFLPSNKVEIPDIGELALSGVELDFVMDDEQLWMVNDEWLMIDTTSWAIQTWVIEEEIVAVATWATQTWVVDTWVIAFEPVQEPISPQPYTWDILPIVIDWKDNGPTTIAEPIINTQQTCTLPRWGTIKNGESVLAYEQRSDDPATCNIQRRVCTNGTLNGSYTQSSCKELFGFNVEKQEVVAYNVPNSNNPYIQPTDSNARSNTMWSNRNMTTNRFNPSVPVNSPSAGWSYAGSSLNTNQNPVTINPNIPSTSTSSSTIRDGTVCYTPRGEEVRNGQFVKAYKVDKWFSNLPCEVELRYCVQTVLEWSFQNESCQHYDIAVEDYLVGHYDPNVPSAMQLAEILHQSADIEPSSWEQQTLWDKVKWFFTSIFK